jgi:hypothetical protein
VSSDLAVLVPVLGRPHRVQPTLRTFAETAPGCRVLFIADPDDAEEIAALDEAGADYISPGGGYAAKIRAGVDVTDQSLIFTGADDLEPRENWLEAAESAMADGIEVVGVNDLIERSRDHATHFLMTRDYALLPTLSGDPGPFHQGYSHWYVDDELIATAEHRGIYAYAPNAQMLHLHPMVGGAEDDPTYQKGRELRRHDAHLFRRRSRLWT